MALALLTTFVHDLPVYAHRLPINYLQKIVSYFKGV